MQSSPETEQTVNNAKRAAVTNLAAILKRLLEGIISVCGRLEIAGKGYTTFLLLRK